MTRRKRRVQPVREVYDHGHTAQRSRLEVVDAADPNQVNRTIRRARVAWVPDQWLARGVIGLHHHQAAVRIVLAYERGILGARDRPDVSVAMGKAVPRGFPDGQLAQAHDYRDAERAVGPQLSAALAWCVLSTGTIEGWAECKGWDHRRAGGYLQAALDRLAGHYGYG